MCRCESLDRNLTFAPPSLRQPLASHLAVMAAQHSHARVRRRHATVMPLDRGRKNDKHVQHHHHRHYHQHHPKHESA